MENEEWEDNETTFEQLYERIDKTVAFLNKVKPESFEGKENAEVVMKAGPNEYKVRGSRPKLLQSSRLMGDDSLPACHTSRSSPCPTSSSMK